MAEPDPDVTSVDDLPARQVGPGIVRRDLPSTEFARVWVIDFEPGSQWPAVDHHDSEERYYVERGEIIEGERRLGPGSYVLFPAGTSHRPRSESGARIIGFDQVLPAR